MVIMARLKKDKEGNYLCQKCTASLKFIGNYGNSYEIRWCERCGTLLVLEVKYDNYERRKNLIKNWYFVKVK
jgi:predicted amidophosphoribosyltransferase